MDGTRPFRQTGNALSVVRRSSEGLSSSPRLLLNRAISALARGMGSCTRCTIKPAARIETAPLGRPILPGASMFCAPRILASGLLHKYHFRSVARDQVQLEPRPPHRVVSTG